MTERGDQATEFEPPEEDAAERTPEAHVVVIQYRSRGLPWYFALPLLVLLPVGAVLLYHRISVRSRGPQPAPAGFSEVRNEKARLVLLPDRPASEADRFDLPLALNSQPITPEPLNLTGELQGPLAGSLAAEWRGAASGMPPAPPSGPPSPTSPSPPPPTAPPATPPPRPTTAPATPPPPPAAVAASPTAPPTRAADPAPASQPPGPKPAAPRQPLAVGFSVPSDAGPGGPAGVAGEIGAAGRGIGGATADPSAERAIAPPAPPAPSREELAQDLKEEAAGRRAAMDEMKSIKSKALDQIAEDTLNRVEDERRAFRDELRTLLQAVDKDTSDRIDALCDRYGRRYGKELHDRALYVLSRSGGRMSREAKARLLRSLGVPEPGILDYLANELGRSLNSRKGPRDQNEVQIQAARQLLAIKLGDPAPPPRINGPARGGRPDSYVPDFSPGNRIGRRGQ
ncbi:hypothetical protein OJF2_25270 [Aquisphaera giovannonii]|uniref:Uncharacterized protein n=1 Tax=Aquisphaera giovannonii TaxID=406548 RepID=A0A5B9W186_9BACT|nr:DUF2852 domain-containing protein [Aquisphaera giovannonii]QEH33994.1 hypothetical protein OJF2_25270 [Aquisphaera giovannonii]